MWKVSMLAVALAASLLVPTGTVSAACPATRPDAPGPFYVAGAPERGKTGDGLTVQGAVRSTRACKGLPAAKVEWWSANANGQYDDGHRQLYPKPADRDIPFDFVLQPG